MLGNQDMDKDREHGIDQTLLCQLTQWERLYLMHVRTIHSRKPIITLIKKHLVFQCYNISRRKLLSKPKSSPIRRKYCNWIRWGPTTCNIRCISWAKDEDCGQTQGNHTSKDTILSAHWQKSHQRRCLQTWTQFNYQYQWSQWAQTCHYHSEGREAKVREAQKDVRWRTGVQKDIMWDRS